MSASVSLTNQSARRIAIHSASLSGSPTGPCDKNTLLALITQLGYVQLDPLQVVARAHDHILWTRRTQYRPKMLDQLLVEHAVFEHFSHDACLLPMDTLPYWKNQFDRQAKKRTSAQWRQSHSRKQRNNILHRIKTQGSLRSNDFKSEPQSKPKAIWTKPEHKKILDYLWLKGDLAVSKRENFTKYYDLAERVYPCKPTQSSKSKADIVHWLSTHAMHSLGFASAGEVMRFWEAIDLDSVKKWSESDGAQLQSINIETDDGNTEPCLALQSSSSLLNDPPKPSSRLRIINPFDPLVRDRKRLKRVFGFDYKIEIYVPAKQRRFGYYVYPLLEGDKFVGRIEVRHERKINELVVDNLWPERKIEFSQARMKKLDSELERLRRFCNAQHVVWNCSRA